MSTLAIVSLVIVCFILFFIFYGNIESFIEAIFPIVILAGVIYLVYYFAFSPLDEPEADVSNISDSSGNYLWVWLVSIFIYILGVSLSIGYKLTNYILNKDKVAPIFYVVICSLWPLFSIIAIFRGGKKFIKWLFAGQV
jgi:hypothetical protein